MIIRLVQKQFRHVLNKRLCNGAQGHAADGSIGVQSGC